MTGHKFGGSHTEKKLKAVREYLSAYNSALKNIDYFNRIYIDAFAGNGERVAGEREDMFGKSRETLPGSAKIALETTPPFHNYYFIDSKPEHVVQLNDLCSRYPNLPTKCIKGDANDELKNLLHSIDWRKNRAVLFLDPYGAEVNWETLELIASKPGIDVWYLFPTMALFRQATLDPSDITPEKERTITRLLGTSEWFDELYKPSSQLDIFEQEKPTRIPVGKMDAIVKKRLETIFQYVHTPLPLTVGTGAQGFSLFIALTNKSSAAIKLAKKFATHIINAT